MKHNLRAWLCLILCLLILLAAMGWISLALLDLDRREQRRRQQAQLSQNARLALWRMDSMLTAMIAREDAANVWARAELPAPASRFIKGYFRAAGDAIQASATVTTDFDGGVLQELQRQQHPPFDPQVPAGATEQEERDHLEYIARGRRAYFAGRRYVWRGVWHGDRLLLLGTPANDGIGRREARLAGIELNWPELRKALLEDVRSLLLEPGLRPGRGAERGLQLAAVPAALQPGDSPAFYYEPPASPAELMLLVAWCCMLLPAVGVAILIVSAMSLNRRRGAFVSAVTHELRTPLTTFRMYTEMLDEGMVPDDKRQEYLTTLRREAERLSHLVENVLTYARIERGKLKETIETVPMAGLLDRIHDELQERVDRAAMELVVDAPDADILVAADTAGVGRILVNLVDNACKYAADATDRRIHIAVTATAGKVRVAVRDHGPGIGRKGERRLFKPFTKSDRDAAHSAAGVGLGLALSQRLAKRMGGRLSYDNTIDNGACFVLELPRPGTS